MVGQGKRSSRLRLRREQLDSCGDADLGKRGKCTTWHQKDRRSGFRGQTVTWAWRQALEQSRCGEAVYPGKEEAIRDRRPSSPKRGRAAARAAAADACHVVHFLDLVIISECQACMQLHMPSECDVETSDIRGSLYSCTSTRPFQGIPHNLPALMLLMCFD